jgi:hypothetical protein
MSTEYNFAISGGLSPLDIPDLLKVILNYIPPINLAKISRVCKQWRYIFITYCNKRTSSIALEYNLYVENEERVTVLINSKSLRAMLRARCADYAERLKRHEKNKSAALMLLYIQREKARPQGE